MAQESGAYLYDNGVVYLKLRCDGSCILSVKFLFDVILILESRGVLRANV